MNENSNLIAQVLAEEMAKDSDNYAAGFIYQLLLLIKPYLNKIQDFKEQINMDLNRINKAYSTVDANPTVINYAMLKELNFKTSDVTQMLQEGELLIDQLRSFFTGEVISYEVGFTYKGTLYETSMTLEDFLKQTKMDLNTRSKLNNFLKLRIGTTSKGRFLESLQSNPNNKIVMTSLSDSSSVYSAIQKYLTNSPKTKGKKINLGNAYEIYKVIVARRGGQNKIPPEIDADLIDATIQEVLSNTASGTVGGDYLNMQIKFFGKSAPSLATLNTLSSTLQSLYDDLMEYYNTLDANALKANLQKLFIKDKNMSKAALEIEEEARLQSIEYLDKIIDSINLTNTKN